MREKESVSSRESKPESRDHDANQIESGALKGVRKGIGGITEE
jgi:hypothetical protein